MVVDRLGDLAQIVQGRRSHRPFCGGGGATNLVLLTPRFKMIGASPGLLRMLANSAVDGTGSGFHGLQLVE